MSVRSLPRLLISHSSTSGGRTLVTHLYMSIFQHIVWWHNPSSECVSPFMLCFLCAFASGRYCYCSPYGYVHILLVHSLFIQCRASCINIWYDSGGYGNRGRDCYSSEWTRNGTDEIRAITNTVQRDAIHTIPIITRDEERERTERTNDRSTLEDRDGVDRIDSRYSSYHPTCEYIYIISYPLATPAVFHYIYVHTIILISWRGFHPDITCLLLFYRQSHNTYAQLYAWLNGTTSVCLQKSSEEHSEGLPSMSYQSERIHGVQR